MQLLQRQAEIHGSLGPPAWALGLGAGVGAPRGPWKRERGTSVLRVRASLPVASRRRRTLGTASSASKPKSLVLAGAAGRGAHHAPARSGSSRARRAHRRTWAAVHGHAPCTAQRGGENTLTRRPRGTPLTADRSERRRAGPRRPAPRPPARAAADLGRPWAFRGLLPTDTQGRCSDSRPRS